MAEDYTQTFFSLITFESKVRFAFYTKKLYYTRQFKV